MTIEIVATAVAAIQAHARSAYPDECCGALIGVASESKADDRRVIVAVALMNEARNERGHRFLISARQHHECEHLSAKLGLDVVGFYHSHPDHQPVPSSVDRALGWPWYCFVITSVSHYEVGPIRAWMLRDDRTEFSEVELSITEFTQ